MVMAAAAMVEEMGVVVDLMAEVMVAAMVVAVIKVAVAAAEGADREE